MRYKAILFDLDGTLLDTLEDLATAANRALGTLGLPAHPTDAYRVFVGDGLRTLAERILPGEQRSAAQVDALVAAFEREYSRTWNERTAPYAGVPEMLDRLTAGGYRLSVLSNKPDAFTRLCVEQLLPHWTFAPLYGQRPGVPKKPDPAAALAIAVELDLDPAEMLDRLTGDGYRMSVLSNKPDAFTRLCVEQLLPHWTFAPLYGQRPGVPKKPDPAAALAIAAELGLDPAEVLYLGDTATDMHTARAAGMAAVGVLWGFRSADELRAAGARHLITHPGELPPLLHPSSAPRS